MSSADPESSSCWTDKDIMPWGWILEYLLDVKELSPLFLKDVIGYVPHIEHPQCSKLVQKLALRYLDEVTLTRELDTCDVLLVRFLLKEQGVSDLRSRIHSLKESFAHDLTLRVETEAVLKNLRSYCKDGRREDWRAFEDAIDNVFSEDMLEPQSVERRKELTAVLPDLSNGESETALREQLLGKYSLEELCRDLARFVDDEKKLFKIKFLDQLAKDVENGVYSPLPGCNSPETRTPCNMYTDYCDLYQFHESMLTGKERSMRKTSDHPSSDGPSMSRPLEEGDLTCRAEDGNGDRLYGVSGVHVSEAKDVRAELSFGIAEVDKLANGFINEGYELVNDITTFTEDVSQPTFVRIAPTSSRISPEKLAKRSVEILEQVTDVAKKRKIDDEVPADEKRDQSASTRENIGIRSRPIVQENLGEGPSKARLSTESDENNTMARVHESFDMVDKGVGKCPSGSFPSGLPSGEQNLPAAGGGDGELRAKCCFCGNSGGCQALCHRCFISIHESCLSKLCIRQEKLENSWYCFTCDVTKAEEDLRKAEEQVLATQTRLATFLSARSELSREQPKAANASVEFNQEAFRGKVTETTNDTIQALHTEQGPSEDFLPDSQVGDRAVFAERGTIAAMMGPPSCSTLQNVKKEDTRQETKMQTQSPVLSEGLCAPRSNDVPGPDFPRDVNEEERLTSRPAVPVTETPAPTDQHAFGYSGNEQSEDPENSKGRVPPDSTSAKNNSHCKSGPHDGVSEDVGATNRSDVSMSDRGHSGPLSDPLSIRRIPEGEGDGHDGDLEEVCEGNAAAAERTNVAEKAAGQVSEKISEASNVDKKSRRRQVYRGRGQIPGVRRQVLPWTGMEEEALKEGVNMFSHNGEFGFQWKRILEFGIGKFHESRTTVDLKDKWRNMLKSRSNLPNLSS